MQNEFNMHLFRVYKMFKKYNWDVFKGDQLCILIFFLFLKVQKVKVHSSHPQKTLLLKSLKNALSVGPPLTS